MSGGEGYHDRKGHDSDGLGSALKLANQGTNRIARL